MVPNDPENHVESDDSYTISHTAILILWFGILVYLDFNTNLIFTGQFYGIERVLFLSKSIILIGMAIVVAKILE